MTDENEPVPDDVEKLYNKVMNSELEELIVAERERKIASIAREKTRIKERLKTPEGRAKRNAYAKEYQRRPEAKEKKRLYNLRNKEKIKKHVKEYNQRPEVREKKRISSKRYYENNREKILKRLRDKKKVDKEVRDVINGRPQKKGKD